MRLALGILPHTYPSADPEAALHWLSREAHEELADRLDEFDGFAVAMTVHDPDAVLLRHPWAQTYAWKHRVHGMRNDKPKIFPRTELVAVATPLPSLYAVADEVKRRDLLTKHTIAGLQLERSRQANSCRLARRDVSARATGVTEH